MYVYVNVCVYINISIICICMFMYFYLYAYVHVGNLHGALSSVSIQGFVIRISSLNPKPKPSNLNPSGPVKGLGMFRVQGQEKLEHHSPRALKARDRRSQHESS